MQPLLRDILIGAAREIEVEFSQPEILALRVIHGSETDAFASWTEFKQLGLDIDTLYLCDAGGILPLLSKRLSVLFPEDPWLGKLKGYYKHTWTQNQFRLQTVVDVVAQMRSNAIETIVLDDAASLLQHYEDVGMKPLSWQSILVRPHQYPAAASLVQAYNSPAEKFRVRIYQSLPGQWHESAWFDAVDVSVFAERLRILALPDSLLHTLLAIKYSTPNRCMWFIDTAALISHCCKQEYAEHLTARALDHQLGLPLAQTWKFFKHAAKLFRFNIQENAVSHVLDGIPISGRETLNRIGLKLKRLYS